MLIELTQDEIREALTNNYIGRIGCRSGERIFIFPVNYVYLHDMVYCQSFEGAKVSMMRQYPDVCFEVEQIPDFNHWKTVIGWGTFEELSSTKDAQEAKQLFSELMLAQKASLTSPSPAETPGITATRPSLVVYYRIRLTELNGRAEKTI